MRIPFGLLRRLRRGVKITIYPTLRCNYDCLYCSQKLYNGEEPPPGFKDELNFKDWCGIIERFENVWPLQHVSVTGGEPTLRSDTSDLVNWLVSRGILVTVYSNFKIDRSLAMIPSPRLRFVTTYHHHADLNDYMMMVECYTKMGHLVITEEIGHANLPVKRIKQFGAYHKVRAFEQVDDGKGGMTDRISFAPDGSLWVWQRMMYEHLFRHYRSDTALPLSLDYDERLAQRRSEAQGEDNLLQIGKNIRAFGV